MFKKNIDLDEFILKKNRIPILIHETEWIELFGNSNEKNIKDLKDKLSQLIVQSKVLESCDENLHKEKTKYMKMILRASEAVNDENNKNIKDDIKLLDGYKKKILEINTEIDDIKFQLETLPKKIRDTNKELLAATVKYGYNEIKEKEKNLNRAVEEIDTLRKKLKELVEIKHDNEEWINEAYVFLHGILGSEVIEKIDKSKFK